MPGFTSVPGFVRFLQFRLKQQGDIIEKVNDPEFKGHSTTVSFQIKGEAYPTYIGILKYRKGDEQGVWAKFLGGSISTKEMMVMEPLLEEFKVLVDNHELYDWFDRNNVPKVGMGIVWNDYKDVYSYYTTEQIQARYDEDKIGLIFSLLAENSENEDLSEEFNELNRERRAQQKKEITAGAYLQDYYRKKYSSLAKEEKIRNYRNEIYFWNDFLIKGELYNDHDSQNEPQIEKVLIPLLRNEIDRLQNGSNTVQERPLQNGNELPRAQIGVIEKDDSQKTFKSDLDEERLKEIYKKLIEIVDPNTKESKYINKIGQDHFIYLFTEKNIGGIQKKLYWKNKAFCINFLEKIVDPKANFNTEGKFDNWKKAKICFEFKGKPLHGHNRTPLTLDQKKDFKKIFE